MWQSKLTEFLAELTEFAAELSEFPKNLLMLFAQK